MIPHTAAAAAPTASEITNVSTPFPSEETRSDATFPPRYAPTHINPACPSESSPRNPTTSESDTARITLIAIFSSR